MWGYLVSIAYCLFFFSKFFFFDEKKSNVNADGRQFYDSE